MATIIATFYKFFPQPDFAERRKPLQTACQKEKIKGTILLAPEGINGTIAGSEAAIQRIFTFLRSDPRCGDLEYKESKAENPPFARLKVRLKKEIVTLGVEEIDPNQQVGTYVQPKDWNALITDPEVLVLDTRNNYEVNIGSFKGAINPQTHSFREFPAYVDQHLAPTKHKKIALFCTGGIRCEKATSLMLNKGFQAVYHLKGGILKYLAEVPAQESLWEGECFVFDERIAVKHGLEFGTYQMCGSCGHPVSPAEQTSPKYQAGISCPYCYANLTEEKRKRREEKQRQLQLTAKRKLKNVSAPELAHQRSAPTHELPDHPDVFFDSASE
ncbi:MAG: rhodanese-related sulfurtransferase [Gomphosphaeria aponina SAG 52.96 = DSM 107014]|uniref:tRNA uridine(34) hydroxylase n=1 Tax=Gomphosphaeria aponina SAG 52.96 = DSM 107014 TaxID=1521640 RepID=A0A941GLI7_9CHRO|nr:rhodanese-related sulfurtransferase [Gomphosphaeria aponina SAG 52.96 = DSM 107014]